MNRLDTRTKILPWAQFAQTAGPTVAGYFDPLTVEHSERLEALAAAHGPLRVAIYDPERPLLPADARAALIASLQCTLAVSVAQAEITGAIDIRPEDLARRERMMAHVHSRHGR